MLKWFKSHKHTCTKAEWIVMTNEVCPTVSLSELQGHKADTEGF